MVFLKWRRHGAQHSNTSVFVRLFDLHDLKAAGQCGVFFDMAFVFVPGRGGNGAQRPTGEGGFEEIGGIASARGSAGTDERVGLIDEQNDRLGRGLHLVDHAAQALFEFTLHARARLEQPDIERPHAYVTERWRHVSREDAMDKALDHGCLADASLAREDGIVLPAAHKDVHTPTDFLVATDDGIDFTPPPFLGQVDGETAEGFLASHFRGRNGACCLARRGSPARGRTPRQAGPR